MSPRPGRRPHGQTRQSQVVSTFGPGALLDLPGHSVLVAGLDHWSTGREQVHEPRLVAKLELLLGVQGLTLQTPPVDSDDPSAPLTGITVWQFPEWFITQDVEEDAGRRATRSRLLVHRKALTRGKLIDRDRRKRPVVPVRFVRACRRGHIGDIDWYVFVHRGSVACRRQLWIDERGTSGDLSEVWVRCECGQERQMSDAVHMEMRALGHCDGARPWLGAYTNEDCQEPNRMLVRMASNAYFPQLMNVISLPEHDDIVVRAVDRIWEHYLQYVETLEQLHDERRRKPPVATALQDLSDERVLKEILSRRDGAATAVAKPVKQAELEILLAGDGEIGIDRPDGDFFARALPPSDWAGPRMQSFDRVALVHRLREVIAQVGFTRFEAAAPDAQGELELGVQRAALAQEISWLPAVENRGEGVFLGFHRSAVEEWLKRPAVQARGRQLITGFECWRTDHRGSRRQFPNLPYIMLHSLSHLLLTAVALECGYPASAIRERVYAGEAGYGILLFTGSPDAEGTLGGLVEAGRSIARHVRAALDLGELCSNDPVCAQHAPENTHERRFLLGAACHGCLLIAETSCEQHNDFLDRALVVPTVSDSGAAFFSAMR